MLGREDMAWDLLHDIFVSLASRAPQLAPDSNLRGYLLTLAANRVRDHVRKRRPRQIESDDIVDVHNCTLDDPAYLVAQKGEASRLWRAVRALPEEQRIVIALHIYQGLAFNEIAEHEGISENTARSRYRYALQKLRQKYAVGA